MTGYHHGNLPRVLLDAALEVMKEQGVALLSLREVARRAGVSHGAPAHHFRDKTGLLTALATEGFEQFRAEMERARDAVGDEPIARFAATGRAYVQFALAHPQHFSLMFQHELIDRRNPALEAAARAAYQVLLDVVAGAQRAGISPELPPEMLATGAWAFGHGLATLLLGGNLQDHTPDQYLAALFPALFRYSPPQR